MSRILYEIPLFHRGEDVAEEGINLEDEKVAELAEQRTFEFLNRVPIDPDSLAYHDTLPRFNPGLVEMMVREIPQFRFAKLLGDRGVVIEGTEDPTILAEAGFLAHLGQKPIGDIDWETLEAIAEDHLPKRDRFIGRTINKTLSPRKTGFLLMGADHQVEDYINSRIRVITPPELFTGLEPAVLQKWLGGNRYERYARKGIIHSSSGFSIPA